MMRMLKKILICILCVTMLVGNISLTTQAAVPGNYTADEIVEEVLERLDAEIAKRPTTEQLKLDVRDMRIKYDSLEWKNAWEEIVKKCSIEKKIIVWLTKILFRFIFVPLKLNI